MLILNRVFADFFYIRVAKLLILKEHIVIPVRKLKAHLLLVTQADRLFALKLEANLKGVFALCFGRQELAITLFLGGLLYIVEGGKLAVPSPEVAVDNRESFKGGIITGGGGF